MRLMAAATLVLVLAGCAGSKPGYVQDREQQRQIDALRQSYDAEIASPAFAILAGKVDLRLTYRGGEDPCAGISEDRLPTAEERIALNRWAALRSAYVVRYEAIAMEEPDGSSQVKYAADQFDAVMDNGLRSEAMLISDLAEGRLTYCRFATEDKALTEGILREAGASSQKFREARQLDYQLSHPSEIGNPYQN